MYQSELCTLLCDYTVFAAIILDASCAVILDRDAPAYTHPPVSYDFSVSQEPDPIYSDEEDDADVEEDSEGEACLQGMQGSKPDNSSQLPKHAADPYRSKRHSKDLLKLCSRQVSHARDCKDRGIESRLLHR